MNNIKFTHQTSDTLLNAWFSCPTVIHRYFILTACKQYSNYTMGCVFWGSNFWWRQEIFHFSNVSTESATPTSPLFIGDQGPLWGAKAAGAWSITTHLHLVQNYEWVDIGLYCPYIHSWAALGQLYITFAVLQTDTVTCTSRSFLYCSSVGTATTMEWTNKESGLISATHYTLLSLSQYLDHPWGPPSL